jgi:hypothetical protein
MAKTNDTTEDVERKHDEQLADALKVQRLLDLAEAKVEWCIKPSY